MTNGDWALWISGISLAISGAGFIWGIYEKFIFVRPHLQVGFSVMTTFPGPKVTLLALSVTNMGPGPAVIHTCVATTRRPWNWRRPWRFPKQYGFLNPIEGNPATANPVGVGPFGGGLPLRVDAASSVTFYFPFTADSFMREPLLDVGVNDTYNRYHWARRGNIKRAKQRYWEAFPDTAAKPA